MCVKFIYELRDLVGSEQQIFKKRYHGNFIYSSEFLPEVCSEEVAEEIFSYFPFDV